jgi:Leucine-rich repeat (LRR) protein
MDNLRILSLGRNLLKKIENVEVVADTLEELWLSYNQIEKLVSTTKCVVCKREPCLNRNQRPSCWHLCIKKWF